MKRFPAGRVEAHKAAAPCLFMVAALLLSAALPGAALGLDVPSTDAAITTPAHGETWALIVSGQCREPNLQGLQEAALIDFRNHLITACGVRADHVATLGIAGSGDTPPATHAAISGAAEKMRGKVAPEDRFIFYYKGQANLVLETLRLNVPGPDMTHEDLARLLSGFDCASMLVVLDCPGAGAAVKSLAADGRVILCGARGDQPYATSFSECFVPALYDANSDFDADGRISVLEAYRAAVVEIDGLFQSAGELKTESALIEDDGDGVPTHQPWNQDEEGYDGRAAAAFFLQESVLSATQGVGRI